MNRTSSLWQGALILTAAGCASRIIGFFYRIFLSYTIGAKGVGLYQLIFPVYVMTFSLSSSGIQTAISKYTAQYHASGDLKRARQILVSGLCLSVGASSLCAIFLFTRASWISIHLLLEPSCAKLLKIIAFAAPFGCIHACLHGCFFGLKRTAIPAISQLLEQAARTGASFLVFCIFLEKGLSPSPVIAAAGMTVGELVSTLFTITMWIFTEQKGARPMLPSKTAFREILQMSLPLTASRGLLTLLQSVEAVCIPANLISFGLSRDQALSVYGVLTGMALPLILFPSALTNALSVMLLPSVSEDASLNRTDHICRTVSSTTAACMWLGIFCTTAFLLTGKELGLLLFHSSLAGSFLLTLAWICPFLYLAVTLTSILNGMGQTLLTFFLHAFSLVIRLLFVWYAIPRFGIQSCLWGLLASELFLACSAFLSLKRKLLFSANPAAWIVKPCAASVISAGVYLFFDMLLRIPGCSSFLRLVISGLVMTGTFFFFFQSGSVV